MDSDSSYNPPPPAKSKPNVKTTTTTTKTTNKKVSFKDVETENTEDLEDPKQEDEQEKIRMEKEAETSVIQNMTRRKIIYIAVVAVVAIAIVFGILGGVMASQIQNIASTGPSPPINSFVINPNADPNSTDPTVQQNVPKIPQGGGLISRPSYLYQFTFLTDLVLSKTGTTQGMILWAAGINGLSADSGAYTRLTNTGLLQVLDASNKVIWSNQNDYSEIPPPGSYTLQVTEFTTGGGQLQILDSRGNLIWFRDVSTKTT